MNAISLRGGKTLDSPKEASKRGDEQGVKDQEAKIVGEKEGKREKEGEPSSPHVDIKPKPVEPYKPPIPFPQRLAKSKLEAKFEKFLEVLKKLHINIPFLDAILEMPSYAKFLKDILSNKRKFQKNAVVSFMEECSGILRDKLPPKVKDPGSFSIPCAIGNVAISRVLYDLGASVSLMPYSICKKPEVGDLKPITISI